VLLLHGPFLADWLAPVGRRLAGDGYRVPRVHRAGYGQSEDLTDGGASVTAHAVHAALVMEDAGVPRAHVVGQVAPDRLTAWRSNKNLGATSCDFTDGMPCWRKVREMRRQ